MLSTILVTVPDEGQRPTTKNFHYELNKQIHQDALDRDGSYVLRSNAIQEDATTVGSMYMQRVHIESAFKSMKSDLAIRPIYHHVQPRVEAHIFIAFMGYRLLAALGKHLSSLAPGQTPKAVLGATGVDPNAGRLPARDRRPLADPAASHQTGTGAQDAAGEVEVRANCRFV